jgi:tetratricopeptide (TPR) repeat protein
MLFAPDWKRDVARAAAHEPPLGRELLARWAGELLARGELDLAHERALTCTEQFPRYATGWFVLASALYRLDRHHEAAAALERCLAVEPEFFAAWDLLASTQERLGRAAAARACRARYRELLGAFAPAEAPPPPAREQITEQRKLIYKGPTEETRVFETPTLAEVYRRQGLLDRALEVYTRILTRHPEDTGARAMVQKLEDEIAARRRPQEQRA